MTSYIFIFIEYESNLAVVGIDRKHPIMLRMGYLICGIFISTSSCKYLQLFHAELQFASCSSVMHLKRSFKLWNKSLEDSQAVLGGEQTSKALFVKLCVLNPRIH